MTSKLFHFAAAIVAVIIFSNQAYANDPFEEQKQQADSLYELVRKFIDINPDTALYYAKQQKRIAFEIDDYEEKVLSCFAIGVLYKNNKSYGKAVNNYFEGLSLLNNPKNLFYKKLKVSYLTNIGVIYINTYNYNLALEYTNKALELA